MRRLRRGDMGRQGRLGIGCDARAGGDRVLALLHMPDRQGAWGVERSVVSRCFYACYNEC